MTLGGEERRDDGMGTWDKSFPFLEPTDPASARQKIGSDATLELRNGKELDVPPSSSHSEGSKLSEQRQAAESAKPPRRWSQRLNPFRWRQIPPVPTERTVSKEYGAGYLSLVTFHWISSLMTASNFPFIDIEATQIAIRKKTPCALGSVITGTFAGCFPLTFLRPDICDP